eukprot:jgi/Antlo1/2236/359
MMTFLRSCSKVGAKNIDSSSGCATSKRLFARGSVSEMHFMRFTFLRNKTNTAKNVITRLFFMGTCETKTLNAGSLCRCNCTEAYGHTGVFTDLQ